MSCCESITKHAHKQKGTGTSNTTSPCHSIPLHTHARDPPTVHAPVVVIVVGSRHLCHSHVGPLGGVQQLHPGDAAVAHLVVPPPKLHVGHLSWCGTAAWALSHRHRHRRDGTVDASVQLRAVHRLPQPTTQRPQQQGGWSVNTPHAAPGPPPPLYTRTHTTPPSGHPTSTHPQLLGEGRQDG